MIIGRGSTTETLTGGNITGMLAGALGTMALDGKRVLVIIPDGTRTAPIPLMFRLLYEQIGRRAERLDYLIALGTHPPMPGDAMLNLAGSALMSATSSCTAARRDRRMHDQRIRRAGRLGHGRKILVGIVRDLVI